MTAITTRSTGTTGVQGVTRKDSPLSNTEIDTNFINLNNNKLEVSDLSSSNTANAGVKRDASGNFSAGTITAALSGNASTATTLQTTRKINNVDFNGSADILTPTIYDAAFTRFVNPGGAYAGLSGLQTGAIAISLPNGFTDTFISMTVKIYEYVTNRSFEVRICGYAMPSTWTNNPTAYVVGSPIADRRLAVRFGYTAGGKAVVYIGETNSSWQYPTVAVTDVQLGWNGKALSFASGWSIGIATTFENVTATIAATDTQVGWTAQSLQTANNYQGNSFGVGTAASGTTGRIDATTLVLSGSEQVNSLGVGTAASGTAGEIRATNAITSYYSDERLKENIVQIDSALSKVMELRGVTFNANKLAESFGFKNKEKQIGVIAQDVKRVVPEAVKPAPFDLIQLQEGIDISSSGENYLTVQYEKLVPLLIEAIKELKQEVDTLRGE